MTSPRLAKFLLAVPLLGFRYCYRGTNVLVSGIGTNSSTWGSASDRRRAHSVLLAEALMALFQSSGLCLASLILQWHGPAWHGGFLGRPANNAQLSGLTQNFDYGQELINTANTNDPFEGADSVLSRCQCHHTDVEGNRLIG